MSIIVQLSSIPVATLRGVCDSGAFPWDDQEAASRAIDEACFEGITGRFEREAELLKLALGESVPTAIRRAIERNPGVRIERCLGSVADYYGQSERVASQAVPSEARWSVEAVAAMMGIIPVAEVGTGMASNTPSAASASAAAAAAERPEPPGIEPVPAPFPAAAPGQFQSPPPSAGTYGMPPAAARGSQPQAPGADYVQPGGAWPPTPGGDGGPLAGAVPDEVSQNKWSWAGFLGGVLWMCFQRLWKFAGIWLGIAVLSFIPHGIGGVISFVGNIALAIYLGINGNRLAWEHRQFESVEQFRKVQRAWVIFALVMFVLSIVLIFVLAPVFFLAFYKARHGALPPGP